MESLKKAIEIIGSQSKLAKKLDITSMAVSQWKKRRVPDWAVLPIEKATNGQVSRHELRPDIYPPEEQHKSA